MRKTLLIVLVTALMTSSLTQAICPACKKDLPEGSCEHDPDCQMYHHYIQTLQWLRHAVIDYRLVGCQPQSEQGEESLTITQLGPSIEVNSCTANLLEYLSMITPSFQLDMSTVNSGIIWASGFADVMIALGIPRQQWYLCFFSALLLNIVESIPRSQNSLQYLLEASPEEGREVINSRFNSFIGRVTEMAMDPIANNLGTIATIQLNTQNYERSINRIHSNLKKPEERQKRHQVFHAVLLKVNTSEASHDQGAQAATVSTHTRYLLLYEPVRGLYYLFTVSPARVIAWGERAFIVYSRLFQGKHLKW